MLHIYISYPYPDMNMDM